MFVGLVRDPVRELPPEPSKPAGRPRWRPGIAWRGLAWAGGCLLLLEVGGWVGGFAGYVILVATLGLVYWRADRWCARHQRPGLRDFQRVG